METKERISLPPHIQYSKFILPVHNDNGKLKRKVLLTTIEITLFALLFSVVIYMLVQFEFTRSLSWADFKDWLDNDNKNEFKPIKKFEPNCKIISDEEKFNCLPDFPNSEKECLNRGCCWNANQNVSDIYHNSIPQCYFPTNYEGYKVKTIEKHSSKISALLQRITPSGFPADVEYANVTVYFYDRNTVRIRITDANNVRFEIPYPEKTRNLDGLYGKWKKPLYTKYAVFLRNNGELVVNRLSDRHAVFKTNLKTLIFSDKFLQLSSLLPSNYIYGLGQQNSPLLKNLNWNYITLFNKGKHSQNGKTNSGSHPFYLAMEKNGNSHGVVLLNSNAMDILLQPTPAITFRPIGGIFDFLIFLGPKPNEVIQQYTKIIGNSFMPPYWSLGFHLSKQNSGNAEERVNILNSIQSLRTPLDTLWEITMHKHNSFLYNQHEQDALSKFVNQLHNIGLHYIFTLDPGIISTKSKKSYPPYDDGLKMNIFVKDNNGQVFIGKERNDTSVVFPDFFHPNITEYWTKQFQSFYMQAEVDGVFNDMNEPTNFYYGENNCPNTSYEYPLYVPKNLKSLHSYTLCMSSRHYNALHYDIHNMYGFMEAIVTAKSVATVSKRRSFITSRSSFPGLGHYAGVWDDINLSWDNMRLSLSTILSFNMFGIPMIGANKCNSVKNSDDDLYSRWSTLESFYPFSIKCNLDDPIEQDSLALHSEVVSTTKQTLATRYFLLPYLYTLFYKSYIFGSTVMRPLFFEYPTDINTYNIDDQFLWGESLMVIPVFRPNTSKVTAYFPQDTWYDFRTNKLYENTGTFVIVDVPLGTVKLAVRGGFIIPGQIPANTTVESRLNDFYLTVALNSSKMAIGDLYWDDGDSVESLKSEYNYILFKAESNTLKVHPALIKYENMPRLGYVKILGCEDRPKSVNVNEVATSFYYNVDEKVLIISNLELSLLQSATINWMF